MINRRDHQSNRGQERSLVVGSDRVTANMEHDLSPAPLWRNAPIMPSAKTSTIMTNNDVGSNQPSNQSVRASSSSSSVIESFQQSLRSYPSSSSRKPVAKIRPKSEYNSAEDGTTRCFVTNLETQSNQPVSSFFLDYLEWNRQQQQQQQSTEQSVNNDYNNTGIRFNEMAINEHQQQFDHSKFMDMFRTSHRRGSGGGDGGGGGGGGGQSTTKIRNPMICESVESSSSLVAMNEADDDDQRSLPYSVNNDDSENVGRRMKSAKDQHQRQAPQQQQQQQQPQKFSANSNVVKMRPTRQVRIQERPKTISFSSSSFVHPSSMVIRNDINSNPVQPRQTSQLPANPVTTAPNKQLQKTTTVARKHQQDCSNLLTTGKITTIPTTGPFTPSVLSSSNNHHNHHQPIGGMEQRNSNRSQSNLNQRLQSAAERRSQIEDAKRERVQRQIEQSSVRNIIHGGGGGHFSNTMTSSYTHSSPRGEQPFLPGHSTNSSLAFGSTQPRNIDLTRPLVTPLTAQQQRPKSEIFSEPLPYSVANGGGGGGATATSKTVPDSSGPIYSKDDANYRINNTNTNNSSNNVSNNLNNNHGKFQNSAATAAQVPVAEPLVVAKQQQQQQISFGGGGGGFGGFLGGNGSGRNMFSSSSSSSSLQPSCAASSSSFLRAGRRHDPELIPAKDKYLFRDYAAPSSGWSFGSGSHLKKENSMMTCSMTSTKSFQTKNLHPSSANIGSGGGFNKPKKSYSMNRLDQLAQPRKRVQARVPISTSFVKGKTTTNTADSQTPTKSPSSVSAKSSSARLETVKPTPPPKNFVHTPKSQPVSKESTPGSGRGSNKKTRPLSQIEVKTDPSVFESPFEKDKEDKEDKEDSLAEYKKQLAEKRAQYRKQQEQKLKQLTKSKPDSDGHNQDNDDDNDDDDDGAAKNDHKISNTSKNTPRVVARRPRSTIIMSTASTGSNVESSPSQKTNSDQSNQNNNNFNNSFNIKSLADETREVLEKQESNVSITGATSGADSGHAPTSSDSSASSSSSSSSASSSSSSSLSSSNESNKNTVQTVTTQADQASNLLVDITADSNSLANKGVGQNVDENPSLMDLSNDSLSKTIIDTNDDKSMEQLECGMKKLSTNEQGQTCDDSSVMQMDKALLQPNSIMTTSFDSSLLHSTSPAALQATAQQMTASPLNANSNSSLTAGQIEERQQEMLKRHEMERQKRKSRIQEILKGRTRKDDGTVGGGGGSGGNGGDLTSSADSSLETSGANSMQTQKRSSLSNGAAAAAVASADGNGVDNNNSKTNGHLTTNGGADADEELIKTNLTDETHLLIKTNGVGVQQ